MRILSGMLVLSVLVGPCGALAADFDAGMRAANVGDFAAAAREWRPLAERGVARAQYFLGELYEEGRGVARDYAEAAKWYRRAAEQGHAQGQNALGILYAEGRGVPLNPVQAYAWFELAVRHGEGFAARNRKTVTATMTAEQIAKARALAAKWRPRPKRPKVRK